MFFFWVLYFLNLFFLPYFATLTQIFYYSKSQTLEWPGAHPAPEDASKRESLNRSLETGTMLLTTEKYLL